MAFEAPPAASGGELIEEVCEISDEGVELCALREEQKVLRGLIYGRSRPCDREVDAFEVI